MTVTTGTQRQPEPGPGPGPGQHTEAEGRTANRAAGLRALKVSYGVGERARHLLVDGVDLEAAPGETIGVVGPNGSGKTTLLRCVYGTLSPTSGQLLLDGRDMTGMSTKERARSVAAVPQDAGGGFGLTVQQAVAMGRSPHKRFWEGDTARDAAYVREALERTGATELAERRVDELSGGERQRVLVARALVQEPALLVLDEPTNHLDVRYQWELLALVDGLAATSVLALHDLNLAAYFCDRIYVLDAGRVVKGGPPAEVLTEEMLAEVYGVRAEVSVHPATGAPTVVYLPPTAAVRAKSVRAESARAESSQAGPSQAGPSQAGPSQAVHR
ncbi:ABC transporter ATP-binding protein [Streptomyces iconiensis]|uniref:ABC transporter ATP-binding protein n=1 Tax=Streptomyces iconiensis TaxID=1384038 RepID=A0ABT7A030_9ACTN|nr:ABC transporter ATP-binding protein [Streptomyces iconiensis]MDJ1134442.1 ABC transporter ATP-binding protein [Streptomyces iconiensis]